MVSGSLLSVAVVKPGAPKERGDETHETESDLPPEN